MLKSITPISYHHMKMFITIALKDDRNGFPMALVVQNTPLGVNIQ